MKCPNCENEWVADKKIAMVITKSVKTHTPKGMRYSCPKCGLSWKEL